MGTITYTVPQAGTDSNATADPEIATALNTIKTWANGSIDAVNLSALLAQSVGANQNAQAVKGAVNIAASESRSNVAYGTMPTPDQVTGIVLPTNGLLLIGYQATWQQSAGTAQAAIFVGANQLKVLGTANGAPTPQAASFSGGGTGTNLALGTTAYGLVRGSAAYSGDVTTGQILGVGAGPAAGDNVPGPVFVWAAAGTYTISVQFLASAGSVTASNRRLWVVALAFI